MNKIVIDIETTGLNPLTDRVTAIGCKVVDEEHGFLLTEVDEALLFKTFESWFKGFSDKETIIVGHNLRFDLPFLFIRFLKTGLCSPDWITDLKTIDTFLVSKSWISLDNMARILNIPLRKNGTGFEAIGLFNRGETEKLLDYLAMDVKMTEAIYKKLLELGSIKE